MAYGGYKTIGGEQAKKMMKGSPKGYADGGGVKMDAGSGGGKGRLEKAKKYGGSKNAKAMKRGGKA